MNTQNAYIMFTDIKDFSKLTDKQTEIFFEDTIKKLAKKVKKYQQHCIMWNTWGDALVAITTDSQVILDLLFDYRSFFIDYKNKNLPKLLPRIATHFGEFKVFQDKLIDKKNALGKNINLTARIEPITLAGEIFATQEFKNHILSSSNIISDHNFQFMGELPLAKNFGEHKVYRLIQNKKEKSEIIELTKNKIDTYPQRKKLSNKEQKTIDSLKQSYSKEDFIRRYKTINIDDYSNEFKFQLAKLLREFEKYNKSLKILQNLEKLEISVYKYDKEFLKEMTNTLTRLGRYKKASHYIMGCITNKVDFDSLSMLGAQYKRMALQNQFDKKLLKKSLNFYLEALRLKIDDYYPAINIAYIYKFLGKNGKAHKMALFVQKDFNGDTTDWWWRVTYLETDLILEDFDGLSDKFKDLIEELSPTYFQRKSVIEQIELYQKYIKKDREIKQILYHLKSKK